MPEAFGPEEFAAASGVSRETLARLKAYVAMLGDWNARHNLVSAGTLERGEIWQRHVWDSAQLLALIPPNAKTLVDLGSGAGFPGLVLAELLRERVAVTLIESTGKKCQFLQAVADRLALPVIIRNGRIEAQPREEFDIVTARAVTALPQLLAYAQTFAGKSTVFLFLKGPNVVAELTEARKSWTMAVRQHPSLTSPAGVILEVRDLHGRAKR